MGPTLISAQHLYIAYYGRPADPVGLSFWNLHIESCHVRRTSCIGVADAFGNSLEAIERFGKLSFAEAVNSVFVSALGRFADSDGLEFYVDQLNRQKITLSSLAFKILEGVGSNSQDSVVLENKVVAANRFTAALNTPERREAYNFESNPKAQRVAIDFLLRVNADPMTIPSQEESDNVVRSLCSKTTLLRIDPLLQRLLDDDPI